ncbi:SpoIVB peptidase [Amphibacillus cookii]|uniref:SpoIVB peptidase n=1 Tax=Amphibacillus cookii TaxID=767787 RepID=UPI001956BAF4|nr:stage IV sporulation protein B [Amphibacillus cookii]
MKKQRPKYIMGIAIIVFVLMFPFIPTINNFLAIPTHLTLYTSEEPVVINPLSERVKIVAEEEQDIIALKDNEIFPVNFGETEVTYKYNNIPLKKVNVNVDESYQVIPGGQSIGVNLQTLGVLVVGYHKVGDEDNLKSPGQDIGIEIGDSILAMNDHEIKSIEDIAPIVEEAGNNNEAINVKFKRDNKLFEEKLHPKFDQKTDGYRLGLYIRDSAAGIGTMTFYDPLTHKYGALGHVISDMDTREPIEIDSGTIVRSTITSIQKGDNGIPGEKRASFNKKEGLLGNITKNSSFGVFGELEEALQDGPLSNPLPVAKPNEVKEGPAKILTVIDGEKIEAFDVEIINAVEQRNPATKGMVLSITDERLLKETGGIVQGMSGSPIIQNDKLIGAVTHVFVNDPTSGYGIHIEWMLDEAGIDHVNTLNKAS